MTTTTGVATWSLACPTCRTPLGSVPEVGDIVGCAHCDSSYRRDGGVWRFLSPASVEHFAGFLADYTAIRLAEGRGSSDPAYYRSLPSTAPDDPLAWQWSMRARTFDHFARAVLPHLGEHLRVVDVGAGVGWLSNRLALLGHQPFAVDLSVDERDGLGALRHLATKWPAVQAEFDRLPLAEGQADAVVFNASLHYSVDYATTLREALRVLRPAGAIVVLDSPVYRHEHSGESMVAERHADFERRFGTRSDAIPSIEYLTAARLDSLANELGLRWERSQAWYGWRWAARPVIAKLKRRREPSRFVVLVARRTGDDLTTITPS